jgi:hypothetical protein
MTDYFKLYEQVKQDYLRKLYDAFSSHRMTEEEYERALDKLNIRVTLEVQRRLKDD